MKSSNTKGLLIGAHKQARSGATVSAIWHDQWNSYLRPGSIPKRNHQGGNDWSNGSNGEIFEENYDHPISLIMTSSQTNGSNGEIFEEIYDHQISLIMTSSPTNTVYICKLIPRGDTNVTSYTVVLSDLLYTGRNMMWYVSTTLWITFMVKTGYQQHASFQKSGSSFYSLEQSDS